MQHGAPLQLLARFGLITGVESVEGLLEKQADNRIGGFEDRRTDEGFEFLQKIAAGSAGGEAGHQLPDLRFLGEESRGDSLFF